MLGRAAASGVGSGDARATHQAPTYRVPGASVAARAAAAEAAGSKGDAGKAATASARVAAEDVESRQRKPAAEVDADGFQTVRGRGWRAGRAAAAEVDADDSRGPNGGGGRVGGDGGQMQTGEDDADAGDGEEAPSPGELHQAWHDELALVKRLRQQGVAASHPAMVAACQARDKAEQLWRGAKDPTPFSVKLSRAQAKLDRSIAIQAESRQAIIDHEKAYRDRLSVLQAKMDEDTARVRTRRRQLEELQAEVGAGGGSGKASAASGAAVKQVHGNICNEIAPALAALAEQLDTSAPAWAMLNGVLSSLATSQTLLEQAFAPEGTQAYNIGDTDDADDGDHVEAWDGSEWSESKELRGDGMCTEAGPPHRADCATADHDQTMGSGYWWEEQGEQWQQGVRWEPCGHGKWHRSSWADTWEQEQRDEDASGGEQPAAVRRRLGPQGGERASEGGGAPPTSTAGDAADAATRKQQHERRVARLVQRSIDAGIQPLTDSGEELLLLDSSQLDQWVATKFPSDPNW